MTTEVLDETSEETGKKQLNLLSPSVKAKLEENNFKFSSFKSTSGFVYWIKRTVQSNGAAEEVLDAAVDRMANSIINAVDGLDKDGQTVNFKVMEKKVEQVDEGKVELGVRIKATNYYTPGHEPKPKAVKVPYVPEFDLDGNIINAPESNEQDSNSGETTEAVTSSGNRRKVA